MKTIAKWVISIITIMLLLFGLYMIILLIDSPEMRKIITNSKLNNIGNVFYYLIVCFYAFSRWNPLKAGGIGYENN